MGKAFVSLGLGGRKSAAPELGRVAGLFQSPGCAPNVYLCSVRSGTG